MTTAGDCTHDGLAAMLSAARFYTAMATGDREGAAAEAEAGPCDVCMLRAITVTGLMLACGERAGEVVFTAEGPVLPDECVARVVRTLHRVLAALQ
jgi:hypothetical protein